MPPPEEAVTTYWLWGDPPQLGKPAIVEVRSWRSGDIEVHTPMSTYIHWQVVGTAAQALSGSVGAGRHIPPNPRGVRTNARRRSRHGDWTRV